MPLGSSVCAELLSVIEGTEFHFKFDAAFRTLSTNFSELWIKHLGGRLVMLKLKGWGFFLRKETKLWKKVLVNSENSLSSQTLRIPRT